MFFSVYMIATCVFGYGCVCFIYVCLCVYFDRVYVCYGVVIVVVTLVLWCCGCNINNNT